MTDALKTKRSTAGLLSDEHKAQISERLGKPDFFGGRYRFTPAKVNGRYRMMLTRIAE